MSIAAVAGAKRIITQFTFRRVLVGSIIFGLFAAVESAAQGVGIVAAYPNMVERARVVHALADNAALGLFYGNRHADLVSPAGYMEYRVLPILSLVGAIWALLFITKMLRGQEETGRWEVLLAGQTTTRKATAKTLIGAAGGLGVAFGLVVGVLLAAGMSPKFPMATRGCLLYGAALISGAAVALAIGAVTSQLAATRRRAVIYGLAVIVGLFSLHSIGNVADTLAWLKNITPFGWIDKIQPFYHPQAWWLLPLGAMAIIGGGLGIWLAGRRDMNESFIAEASGARPHTHLLNTPFGFHFRLTRGVIAGWLIANIALATVIAGVTKTVAQSLDSSGTLTQTFSNLSGNPSAQFELAYLGAASYITVTILMVLVTTSIGSLRDEEASGRLDNIVSGTLSRRQWLGARIALLLVSAVVITVLTNVVVWSVAHTQGVTVNFGHLIFGGLNIVAPVIVLLGVGVLLYGLVPRWATIGMYIVVAWSFTVDIIASIVASAKHLANTSLLHYIALVPAATPRWRTFATLTVLGVLLLLLGLAAFQRRDLQTD